MSVSLEGLKSMLIHLRPVLKPVTKAPIIISGVNAAIYSILEYNGIITRAFVSGWSNFGDSSGSKSKMVTELISFVKHRSKKNYQKSHGEITANFVVFFHLDALFTQKNKKGEWNSFNCFRGTYLHISIGRYSP
jgi:hypothetical protein